MNKIKSFIAFTLAIFCVLNGHSQSGYMGKTKQVFIGASLNPGIMIRSTDLYLKSNISMGYEMVTMNDASWVFGFNFGSAVLDQYNLDDYGSSVTLSPADNSFGASRPQGVMEYNHQSLSAQRRWYIAASSVAPYGTYIGLETNFARAKQTTADLLFLGYGSSTPKKLEPEKSRSHFSISENFVIGSNRIIGDKIIVGAHVSAGYVLFQSSRPSFWESYTELNNHMDVQENIMMRHFAMSRILQVGINVGYLF